MISQSSQTSRCRGGRVLLIPIQRDRPSGVLPGNGQRKNNVPFLYKDNNNFKLIPLSMAIQLAIYIYNDIDDSRPSSKGEKSYWILIREGHWEGRAGRRGDSLIRPVGVMPGCLSRIN